MIKVNTSESCFAAAGEIGLGAPGAVITATGASNVLPAGCSVQRNISSSGPARLFWNTNAASTVGCGGAAVSAVAGSLDRESNGGLVGLELAVDGAAQVVNITMSGPANVWFGVGFNTLFMDNAPYAITVDGTTGVVTERVLGHHTAGIILNVSVTVVHTAVSDNVRTIMLQRATKGLTPHHHDFDPTQMSMDVIAAVGSAPAFGYHKAKTAATMPMWPARARIDPTAGGGNFALFGATQPPAQGTRNNYDGEVGFTFTAAHPLNVTALGRSGTALKAPTAVTLWDAKTRARLASVSVGPTSTTTTSDGYTYANLAAPVLLTSGTSYYITQTVTNGMPDAWVDTAANAASIEPWFGSAGAGVYSSTKGAAPDQTSTTGRWAGMVTLRATVAPHAVPGGGKDGAMPAACVCAVPAAPFGKGKGTIKYLPTGEVIGFPPRCNLGNADYSVMKNHNPTCDIRTYVGGLSTCHHGWHLLDADQELPWQDKPITYYLKFRLYYQPYTPPAAAAAASDDDAAPPPPEKTLATTVAERVAAGQASHIGVFDITWSIAGDTGEYDVPQCAPGTPASECTHEIHGTIVPPGDDYHFVAAHYHCHAPTCIKLEIYNNRTGELLCSETPYHGAVDAASQKNRFDEPGYIAQRICLWGLQPPFEYPPLVSGETLFVRSITNSSYNHHGEMALPQMLLAQLPK